MGVVMRLRLRKLREEKPLAVMANDIEHIQRFAEVQIKDEELLTSIQRPIVLLKKKATNPICEEVAPRNNYFGVMLPYSPLHHLLLAAFGRGLVATSANISGEPVLTEAVDVEQRIGPMVDAFLHHDRPIVRPADDPVIRPMAGAARAIRLGRGIAPLERSLGTRLPRALLATGGHLKVTVALAWEDLVCLSVTGIPLWTNRSQSRSPVSLLKQ